MLTQVAGRSGRAEEKGKVVLQTYSPDNAILRYAINYDYKNFFKQEISVRKATAFPPYTDVVRVLISGEDQEKTLETTKRVYEELKVLYNARKDDFRFFGCMKAPLNRLQNKYRFQVLMRITAEKYDLLDKIFEISNKHQTRLISVYMEVNSNNLT